ncbi:hypothetical protein J6590_025422 [Homalodisca vitripennis]|nr:hypothetical protein J6590_025422 [Homalodisca vitripennis]
MSRSEEKTRTSLQLRRYLRCKPRPKNSRELGRLYGIENRGSTDGVSGYLNRISFRPVSVIASSTAVVRVGTPPPSPPEVRLLATERALCDSCM